MTDTTNQQPIWQNTIEKLLSENLKEQKSRRRWGIFFKIFYLIITIVILIGLFSPKTNLTNVASPHTSVVDISNAIMPGDNENSADNVVSSLTKAFKDHNTVGVILRINSPGGSPVQSSEIYNAITELRGKYPQKKIYAVCEDLCASGAYYVASATNNIYANPSSLVGSIGVLLNGFGFVGAMDKLGIQRRLLTAGTEKGFLDPFSPMSTQDTTYAKEILENVHQQFIRDVEKGRGNRLKKNPQLFSGLVWTGEQAKNLGLIDGFGDTRFVANNIIKNSNIVNYTQEKNIFNKIARKLGTSFAHEITAEFTQATMQ